MSQSTALKLPPATLYVDDIEQIVDMVRAAVSGVELTCPGYKLESAAELIELGRLHPRNAIREIDIRGKDISINLAAFSSRIYLHEDTDLLLGLGVKVRDFVRARRKFLSPNRAGAIMWLIGLAFFAFPASLFYERAAIALCCFAMQFWCMFKDQPPYCALRLVRRAEKPSFLERHGSQLAIAALSALLGAVATWLLGRLF